MTRPVLLAAHHVCEVALKTACVAHAGTAPRRGHYLEPHWTRLAKASGLRHLDSSQMNEARDFISLMEGLTPDGQTTRYPMPGIDDLGATWCRLNSSGLRDAVCAFVARLEPRQRHPRGRAPEYSVAWAASPGRPTAGLDEGASRSRD